MTREVSERYIVLELDEGLGIVDVAGEADAVWKRTKGEFLPDLISGRDRTTLDLVLRSAQARQPVDTFAELIPSDGSQFVRMQMQPRETGWMVTLARVESRDAVYELIVARQRHEGVMRATATGIVSLDPGHTIVDHNERFFHLLGFRSRRGVEFNEDGLRGRNLICLCRENADLEALAEFLDDEQRGLRGEKPGHVPQGTRLRRLGKILEFQKVPTHMPHFGFTGSSVLVRDVSAETELVIALEQLKLANEKLNRLATQDPLTHLQNRRGVEEALAANTALGSRVGFHVVALIIDLDDFKAINTEHGYEGGDAVLREVARRLEKHTRSTDIVGRIGGDEFLIILPDTDLQGAITTGNKICLAIKEVPVSHGATDVAVSASLGVADLPRQVKSIAEILRLTRRTIEASKAGGKGMVSFEPET